MSNKQLKGILERMEALKPANLSTEFQAGIDAAKDVVSGVLDKTFHSERIKELEAELKELKKQVKAEKEAKAEKAAKPKKKVRKTKAAQPARE